MLQQINGDPDVRILIAALITLATQVGRARALIHRWERQHRNT